MPKIFKNSLIGFTFCLAFMLFAFNSASFSQEKKQEKKADAKLLDEIAGSYEFDYQGQIIVFVFSVEDGKLMGAPEGEGQEVIEPVEGEEMTFVGYSPDGTEYQFKFERDEEGKITKCTASLPAMGIKVEGIKIKDGNVK
ncbi:MAG: hypothetical protein JSV96_18485 [Candidatus Aminicenantes bacterium]|nr:MAG: hypothetical protein JSV96_18485 [Candidatus Aminicenantes bacterium]